MQRGERWLFFSSDYSSFQSAHRSTFCRERKLFRFTTEIDTRVHEAKCWKGTLHYIHATRKRYFGLLFFFKLERTQGSRRTQGDIRARAKTGVRTTHTSNTNITCRSHNAEERCPRASYFPSAYLYCSDSPNRPLSLVSNDPSFMSSSRREYFENDRIAVMKPASWAHHTRTHAHKNGEQVKRALTYGRLRTWEYDVVIYRRRNGSDAFLLVSGQLFRRLTSI